MAASSSSSPSPSSSSTSGLLLLPPVMCPASGEGGASASSAVAPPAAAGAPPSLLTAASPAGLGSPAQGSPSAWASSGPKCLYVSDHASSVVAQLQLLRGAEALTDLQLVCQETHFRAHKVVMAAAASFFKEQFCKANVMMPVIIDLKDFGLNLKKEALGYVIDFIYRGEVVVPGPRFNEVCGVVHALGVHGLVDIVPNPDKRCNDGSQDGTPGKRNKKHPSEGFVHLTAESVRSPPHEPSQTSTNRETDTVHPTITAITVPSSHLEQSHGLQSSSNHTLSNGLAQLVTAAHTPSEFSDPATEASHTTPAPVASDPSSSAHNEMVDVIVDLTEERNSSTNLHYSTSAPTYINPIPPSASHLTPPSFLSTQQNSALTSALEYPQVQTAFPQQALYHQQGSQQHPQSVEGLVSQGTMVLQYGANAMAAASFVQPELLLTETATPSPGLLSTSSPLTSSRGKQVGLISTAAAPMASIVPTVSDSTAGSSTMVTPPTSVLTTSTSLIPSVSVQQPSTNTTAARTATPITPSSSGRLRIINQDLLSTSHETNIQQSRSSTPMSNPSTAEADLATPQPTPDHVMLDVNPGSVAAHWTGSPAWNSQSELVLYEEENGISIAWPSTSSGPHTAQDNWNTPTETETSDPVWNLPVPGPPSEAQDSNQATQINEKKALHILQQKVENSSRGMCSNNDENGLRSSVATTWHRSEPPPPSDDDDDNSAVPVESTSSSTAPPILPIPSPNITSPDVGSSFSPFRNDNSLIAMKPGIPLALQTRKRRRATKEGDSQDSASPFESTPKKKNSPGNSKRGDLEVRKDLTLPSAPTAEETNVFQSEDSNSRDCAAIDPGNELEQSWTVHCPEVSPLASPTLAHRRSPSPSPTESTIIAEEEEQMSTSKESKTSLRKFGPHQPILGNESAKSSNFRSRNNVNDHQHKVHAKNMFRCESCNYETPVKASFVRHNCINDGPRMSCTKCPKEFKSKVGLRLHLKTHVAGGSQLFKCADCDFASPQKVSFVRHLAAVHKKDFNGKTLRPDFKCDKCNEDFVSAHLLRLHSARKHTDRAAMPHKCNICSYASVEKAALLRHVRFRHTGERPFVCNECGFATHTAGAMARHARAHSGAKPYSCVVPQCNMAYADRKRLREHMAREHPEEGEERPVFECDECGVKFGRKDNLKTHIERKHMQQPAEDDPEDLSQDPSELHLNPRSRRKPVLEEVDSAQDVTTDSEEGTRSHIVGHINEDGTIQPVATGSVSRKK